MKTKKKTLSISLEILSNNLQQEDYSNEAKETFIELIKVHPGPESDQDSKQNDEFAPVSSLKRTRLDLVICSVNLGLIPHHIQKVQIDDIQ